MKSAQQDYKTLLKTAFAGAAALGLSGCITLDNQRGTHAGFPAAPQAPIAAAPQIQPLPAGVRETAYYGNEAPGTVLIDIARHRLFYVQGGGRALSYPIGAPRNGIDIPPHNSIVSAKRVNPGWTPTANMRARNPNLPAHVPGGTPGNPLGVRALYLGDTLYRIHGTNEPQSIGTNASSGCIRMHNEHVIDLYERVPVGAAVKTYRNDFVPGIAYQDSPARPALRMPGL